MAIASELPIQTLDAALGAVNETPESRINFMKTLASSAVKILADKPWDKRSPPDSNMHMLFVSDGDNLQQPMLAVFTDQEIATSYLGDSPTIHHAYQHIIEAQMGWALLGIPPHTGIMVNPNSGLSFRISPEMTSKMRSVAQFTFFLKQSKRIVQNRAAVSQERKPLFPPAVASAHNDIQQMVNIGKFSEAEQRVSALEAASTSEEYILCLRAILARAQGNHPHAIQLFRQALGKTHDARLAANFWSLLAQVLDETEEPEEAEYAYFQAQAGDPLEITNTMNLAVFLSKHRRVEEALTLLRRGMEAYPSDPALAALVAQLLVEHDEFDSGLATLEQLITKFPTIAGLHYNRAVCLQMLGRLDEATPEYEQALRLDPNMDGHSQYVHTRKFSRDELSLDHLYVKTLERRTQDDMPLNSRIDANFALVQIYETMGDVDRAFAHMQVGNTLKRAGFKKYSIEIAKSEISNILSLYSKQFIEAFKNAGASDLAPIFVLGMPRSGTTLTEQILAAHTRINPGSEMPYLGEFGDEFVKTWSGHSADFEQHHAEMVQDLQYMAAGYSKRTKRLQEPSKRFTDKMPGNFLNIGLIYLLFPHASVIHCQRHPMDNCLSCYERLFSQGIPYSYDLRELGEYYKTYRQVMSHWHSVLPSGFILNVQYEQLVDNLEGQIRRILNFCGLEFEDACMHFQDVKRSVKTASSVQVRKPLYKTSVNRWLKYREKLTPLIEVLGQELGGANTQD